MSNVYAGREQTETKHFLLRSYLYQFAYKLLSEVEAIAFVDGFSGPWHSRDEQFRDTSFYIALSILSEVKKDVEARGKPKTIYACFVEKDRESFEHLQREVSRWHSVPERFFVRPYLGRFEDVVDEISAATEGVFRLVFIDPTGWSGYPMKKIGPLLQPRTSEAIINFMYDHTNRFGNLDEPKIKAQFDALIGREDWRDDFRDELPIGENIRLLLEEALVRECGFEYVSATCVEKSTIDRPHFYLIHGTHDFAGLNAYRDAEHEALSKYVGKRQAAKSRRSIERGRKRDEDTGQWGLFGDAELGSAPVEIDTSFQDLVFEQISLATMYIEGELGADDGLGSFIDLCKRVMPVYSVRKTHVKDIVVDLAQRGLVVPTWKNRNPRARKPSDDDKIVPVKRSTV